MINFSVSKKDAIYLILFTLFIFGAGFYIGWINSNFQGRTAKEWFEQNNVNISEVVKTQGQLNDEVNKYNGLAKSCGSLLSTSNAIYTLSKQFTTCLNAITTYTCNGMGSLVQSTDVLTCMKQYGNNQ